MAIIRRLPKKGFNNPFRKVYSIINVGTLNELEDGTTIDPATARKLGIVKSGIAKVKVLGKGKLEKKLWPNLERRYPEVKCGILHPGLDSFGKIGFPDKIGIGGQ